MHAVPNEQVIERVIERRVLSGEVDIASRKMLAATLSAVPDCDELIVDLRAVTYIDSTGLSELVALKRRLLAQCGATVRILVATPSLLKMLRVCGFEKLFVIEEQEPGSS